MSYRKKSLFTIIFLLFIQVMLAQSPNIRFRYLTNENGLSQNSVICILQDSKGFMWFGTEDGLNRYNGYEFEIFTHQTNEPASLSNSFITSLYEDTRGNIWIGTKKGLNKYDPVTEQFHNYSFIPKDKNQPQANDITAIAQDTTGQLWIGTGGAGVYIFNPETQKAIHYYDDPANNTITPGNNINSIITTYDGTIWIGTAGAGLFRVEKNFKGKIKFDKINIDEDDFLTQDFINTIYEDNNKNLWIGTDGEGLYKINLKSGEKEVFKNNPLDKKTLPSNYINTIGQDQEDNIWVGTNGAGLGLLLNDAKGKKYFVNYRPNANNFYSLSSDFILSIYRDRSGLCWVGTFTGGVNVFDRSTESFKIIEDIPVNTSHGINDYISSIYENLSPEKHELWIGTMGGGLTIMNRKTGTFKNYSHNPYVKTSIKNNVISAIHKDKRQRFWIGTWKGLDLFNPKTKTFKHISIPECDDNCKVLSIYESRSGSIWIGTSQGISRIKGKGKDLTVDYFQIPGNTNDLKTNVRSISEDKQGNIWLGTLSQGLFRLTETLGKVKIIHFSKISSQGKKLLNTEILCLHNDSKNNLWIGTWGNGLFSLNPQNNYQLKHLTLNNNLPNMVINGILEDDKNNLWVSTNNGLSKIAIDSLVIKNYFEVDGLQNKEFNPGACFKSKSGEMFFGGINGINMFFPDSIKSNPYKPDVYITKLLVNNMPVNPGEKNNGRVILKKSIFETSEIKLSHTDNLISFEFAALNYRLPEKNQYAYKLEGLEEEWNQVKNRRYCTYTNLPPGTYTFKVKGANNAGVWNHSGDSIRIVITPPFWREWWFYAYLVIFLAVTIYLLMLWREKSLQKHNRELEQQVKTRTRELEKQKEELSVQLDLATVQRDHIERQNNEIKRAQEEINQAKKFTDSIISQARDGIVVINSDDKFVLVNDAFINMMGYTQKELLQMNIKEMSSGNWDKSDLEQLALIREGNPHSFEKIFKRKDSSLFPVTVSGSLLSKSSKSKAIVAIIIDDTERKRNEKELNKYRVHLEKLVEERTHDLLAAKEKAEKADKLKTAFLANLSHEVRTPMNAILGFSSLLSDDNLTDKEREDYLDHINVSSENLLQLIDDIIDISQIESNQLKPKFEKCEVNQILNEMYKHFKKDRRRKIANFVELRLVLPERDENITIITDGARLRQILKNLIENALKFTDEGFVEFGYDINPSNELQFYVKDTGMGIPEEMLKVIFERFRKIDVTKNKLYGGTGLGLAISKQLAELLGGRMWVKSTLNKGSTFYFTMPYENISPEEKSKDDYYY